MWNQAKNDGFWATWAHLVDLTDPRGEINAYKVRQKVVHEPVSNPVNL